MQKLSTAVALALTGAAALHTHASDKLEEMVVTSSRVAMPLREVATSISVVTKEDIQLRGFSSVANILRYEPAISVTTNGGAGSPTEVRIRGERGYRTKVYIDGIDITDTSTPQSGPNFGNMVTGSIDRIEILRGPEGLIYGADAGGVINMYTASPEAGFSGGVDAEGGRYGTQQYSGHLAGGSEVLDGAISAQRFETDGFNALTTDTVLQDDDGYKNTTLHGRTGWNITDSLRAELVGRTVEGNNDYDACYLPSFDRTDRCKNDYDQDAGRVALIHTGQAFSNSLAFNEAQTHRKFYTEGVNDYTYKSELQTINYLGSWKDSEALSMVYGIDLERDSVDDDITDNSRDQEGYFAEYQGGFMDSLYVTAGLRYTDNEDFGSKTTYRTGATYLIAAGDGQFKLKAVYGTGFRAPSLSEIAYNAGPDAYPPAQGTELDAEQSTGYDVGVGYYATAGWYVDATYFDQKIDDEIYFDLIDFSGYLQESGESSSSGLELVSEVPLWDSLVLSANYTYTDTQDINGEQRLRTPKHMGNLGVRYSPWNGLVQFNLNYRVARDTAEEATGSVDDYEILDLSVTYQVLEALQVYARVENATDEHYQEVPNYNTPGAAGYAGVRYRFQ